MLDAQGRLLVAHTGQEDVTLLPHMANRHGLITGATGSGKTVTLQTLAEGFSALGTPVFVTDIKGETASYVVMYLGTNDQHYPETANMRHILVKSVDADGDGMVYYLIGDNWNWNTRTVNGTSFETWEVDPVDGPAYEDWRGSFLQNALPVSIPYKTVDVETVFPNAAG